MSSTIWLSVASLTWLLVIAVCRALPKYVPEPISMSRPALAEAAVEWVPPQSDMTKPPKPIWLRSAVVSVSGFSHAYTLLMRLYEHITAPAPPCWIAAWYCGR